MSNTRKASAPQPNSAVGFTITPVQSNSTGEVLFELGINLPPAIGFVWRIPADQMRDMWTQMTTFVETAVKEYESWKATGGKRIEIAHTLPTGSNQPR